MLRGGIVALLTIGVSCTYSSPPGPGLPSTPEPSAEPAPAPAPAPVEAPSDETASPADTDTLLDTWSLAAKEDGPACRRDLESAGFEFRALPDREAPDKSGCGMPHGVVVARGPTGIVYDPPIMVDCAFARALGSVERIVQEEASASLGSRITKIANLGAFACRPRNYRKGASLSAHAFGSALDVSAFHPAKGAPAVVVRDYSEALRSTPARDERRRFLHEVYLRLRREADLTYTVGPDFNAIHRNHFHLDRGGWRFWYARR